MGECLPVPNGKRSGLAGPCACLLGIPEKEDLLPSFLAFLLVSRSAAARTAAASSDMGAVKTKWLSMQMGPDINA